MLSYMNEQDTCIASTICFVWDAKLVFSNIKNWSNLSQTLKISIRANWLTKLLIINICYWFLKKEKKINANNASLLTSSINVPIFFKFLKKELWPPPPPPPPSLNPGSFLDPKHKESESRMVFEDFGNQMAYVIQQKKSLTFFSFFFWVT